MSYQMYRITTLGSTLQESLDDLIQSNQISPNVAFKVMAQFDKVVNTALEQRVKSRLNFKAEHLEAYRFCDNVWTFILKNVEFKDSQGHGHGEPVKVSKVKIVACDGKSAAKEP